MKIAVAARDESRIAPRLGDATLLHVFEVCNEKVEVCTIRELPDALEARHASPRNGHASVSGEAHTQLVAFGADPAEGEDLMLTEPVPEEVLDGILDCQIVIAERIGPVEELELRRLGILALPMTVPATPEEAVRMAVSGTPPAKGEHCRPCPHPATRTTSRTD